MSKAFFLFFIFLFLSCQIPFSPSNQLLKKEVLEDSLSEVEVTTKHNINDGDDVLFISPYDNTPINEKNIIIESQKSALTDSDLNEDSDKQKVDIKQKDILNEDTEDNLIIAKKNQFNEMDEKLKNNFINDTITSSLLVDENDFLTVYQPKIDDFKKESTQKLYSTIGYVSDGKNEEINLQNLVKEKIDLKNEDRGKIDLKNEDRGNINLKNEDKRELNSINEDKEVIILRNDKKELDSEDILYLKENTDEPEFIINRLFQIKRITSEDLKFYISIGITPLLIILMLSFRKLFIKKRRIK